MWIYYKLNKCIHIIIQVYGIVQTLLGVVENHLHVQLIIIVFAYIQCNLLFRMIDFRESYDTCSLPRKMVLPGLSWPMYPYRILPKNDMKKL